VVLVVDVVAHALGLLMPLGLRRDEEVAAAKVPVKALAMGFGPGPGHAALQALRAPVLWG
jgi:hypothetical protein